MSTTAIVSYDGTSNDDDAVALASVLAEAGVGLILAYVRHSVQQGKQEQERLAESEAQALLDRGVATLGGSAQTRVVVHASTASGLKELAEREGAELVVFGSAYRTPAGRVAPQKTAESLLDNGPVAVAIAPAGYRAREIATIGVFAGSEDAAPVETARSLAGALRASVGEASREADLLIVGSREQAQQGRVLLSAQSENAIEESTAPVLVVARGAALSFGAPICVA